MDAHPDKSGILVLGSLSFQNKIKKELQEEPINFGQFQVKIKTEDKYLRHIIKSNLASSATEKER